MGFSMFSAQASPIAIDFGSSSVKLLQIGSSDAPNLVAAAELPVPDELRQDQAGLFDFYARELPRMLKKGKFRGKRVVSAIPSAQTLVQHMQIASVGGANIDDVVKGQLQVQMGCSPRSIVVRSLEVADVHRGGQAQKEIICFAVSRETVMRYVGLLKRCKLEPVGMHTETMAMVRAFDHLNRRAEDTASTTLYVDLGWNGTLVAVGHGRNIRFARYIQIGGCHFDSVIADALTCSPEEARERRIASSAPLTPVETEEPEGTEGELAEGMAVIKQAMAQATAKATGNPVSTSTENERRAGKVPAELRYQIDGDATPEGCDGVDMSELIETIGDELSMCLRYHRVLFPDRPIDRVIFLGGEARQTWLCQHLIRTLRLPAQLGDPLARFENDGSAKVTNLSLDDPQPGWAVACGLCIAPTDL